MASIKRAASGKWRARFRDPSGREHCRHFDRKTDAQRWVDEQTAAVVTGQYVDPRAGTETLRDYAERWRAAQVHRPSTVEKTESILRRHVYPVLGDKPLASIYPTDIQQWVRGLDLSPRTVAVVHGVLAGIFRAAVRDRRITASPCDGVKLPRVQRDEVEPLDLDAVAAIRDALPPRLRALVTLGAATGVRLGEATGLTVDRTGLQPPSARPELRVDRTLNVLQREAPHLGPPKTAASRRSIPLPQVAVDALAAHLAEYPPEPQPILCRDGSREWTETVALVFTTPTGAPIRRSWFSERWRAAVREAGAPEGTRFHQLRHTYASMLIRFGESVKTVQARLGHATAAETLDTYSHLWPDSADRTRAAVDSVLGVADSVRTEGGAP